MTFNPKMGVLMIFCDFCLFFPTVWWAVCSDVCLSAQYLDLCICTLKYHYVILCDYGMRQKKVDP